MARRNAFEFLEVSVWCFHIPQMLTDSGWFFRLSLRDRSRGYSVKSQRAAANVSLQTGAGNSSEDTKKKLMQKAVVRVWTRSRRTSVLSSCRFTGNQWNIFTKYYVPLWDELYIQVRPLCVKTSTALKVAQHIHGNFGATLRPPIMCKHHKAVIYSFYSYNEQMS